MRCTVDLKELKKALIVLNKVIPKRSGIEGVKIAAQGDTVVLTGTDLQVGVVIPVKGNVEEAGAVLIDFQTLRTLSKPSKDIAEVTFEVTLEGDDTLVKIFLADGRTWEVPTCDMEDYPQLDAPTTRAIKLTGLTGVKKCLPFCNRDNMREVLNGVHIQVGQEEIRYAASEGHILKIVYQGYKRKTKRKTETIIPIKACKVLAVMGTEAIFRVKGKQASFENDYLTLYTQLIVAPGGYPAVEQIVDFKLKDDERLDKGRRKALHESEEGIIISANRLGLMDAVFDAAEAIGYRRNSSKKPEIHITGTATKLQVQARSGEMSMTYPAGGCCNQDGFTLAVNAHYLHSCLDSLDRDKVKLMMKDDHSPIFISDGNIDECTIMMPIRKGKRTNGD